MIVMVAQERRIAVLVAAWGRGEAAGHCVQPCYGFKTDVHIWVDLADLFGDFVVRVLEVYCLG